MFRFSFERRRQLAAYFEKLEDVPITGSHLSGHALALHKLVIQVGFSRGTLGVGA